MLDGRKPLCAGTVWEKGVDGSEELVYSPPHYTVGGFEALDVIKAKLTPEEYRGYCKGNILKYVMRANYKGTHDTDCGKAEYYAKELNDATVTQTNED